MKNTYLILVLLFSSNLIFGQEYDYQNFDPKNSLSIHIEKERKTLIEHAFYQQRILESKSLQEEDIRIDSMVWESKDRNSEDWTFEGKWEYLYNDDGAYSEYTRIWNKDKNLWDDSLKIDFFYEGEFRVQENYIWDNEANQWVGMYKYESQSNENSKLLISIRYDWDKESNSWIPESKSIWEYYETQKTKKTTRYRWISSIQEWVLSYVNEFDADGIEIYNEDYEYNEESKSNITSGKTFYAYGENALLVERVLKVHDSDISELINNYKIEYQYNDQNQLILEIFYNWIENVWEESDRKEHSYENEGKTINTLSYVLAEDGSKFYRNKSQKNYNDVGRLIYNEWWRWDDAKEYWYGIFKYGSERDTNNVLLNSYVYEWDFNVDDWYGVEKFEYTNNEQSHLSYKGYYWDFEAKNWSFLEIGNYYYSDHNAILDVDELAMEPVYLLYPNPTSNIFQFNGLEKIESIKIYDLQGKLQKEFHQSQNVYSIEDLNSGIYNLVLHSKDGIQNLRLVKQ